MLAKILHPLLQASQDLLSANQTKRRIEQLKHSYPDRPPTIIIGVEREEPFPPRTKKIVDGVNQKVERYNRLIASAEVKFREAEAEFGAGQFRLPPKIASQLKELKNIVGDLSRLVNDGLFSKADVRLAEFGSQYQVLERSARGWQLENTIEGVLKRLRGTKMPPAESSDSDDLTKAEMDEVCDLLQIIKCSALPSSFAIHPPSEVLECEAILEADDLVERLSDAAFSIVLHDGDERLLSLPQLMAFVFNWVEMEIRERELEKMLKAAKPTGPQTVTVTTKFSMKQLMEPTMVKTLLSFVRFSNATSDAGQERA